MDSRDLQGLASVAAGGLLAAVGARKGGRNGVLLSLAGAGLAVMGVLRGRGSGAKGATVFERTNSTSWRLPRERLAEDARAFGRSRARRGDVVQEASEESFPASDAPSHTPTTSIGGHDQ